MSNIAINGFGRIGRSILRIIIEQDIDINVVAINDLGDYENLAYLFKHDSIMGILDADISIHNDTFKICLLYTSPSPRDLSTSRMPSSA